MSEVEQITSILTEDRVFAPTDAFLETAYFKDEAAYDAMCARAKDDPEGFWADVARTFEWFEPFDKVLEWELPHAKWFLGGKTNISVNCLDRHVS